jgi:phosphate uptake regulator|tara:strand:- start:42 stop:476 length:435 start_codon:yes stop_codon:yes gene_type:complete
MDMNDLYKYLGMFIVGLFFLFIMFNGFRVQNIMLSSLVTGDIDNKETFENINRVSDELDTNTKETLDPVLIKEYERDYETLIHKLDSNISTAIIKSIKDNAEELSKKHMTQTTQDIIVKINNLKNFKDTLNTAQTIMDSDAYKI